MHTRILSLLVLIALPTACKDGLATKVEKLADEACACKDAACVSDVGKRMKELQSGSEKPGDDEMPKIKAALERMQECASKHAGG